MNNGNPYAPPMTDVSERVVRGQKPWKGLLYGVVIDIGGGIVVAMAVGFGYMAFLISNGVPSDQIKTALLHPGLFFSVLEYVIGYSFSILGGYVCARVIKEHELRWALIMFLITSVIGLLTTDRHTSIEKFLLETVGEFMCVVGGAWLGMKQNRRQLVR